MKLDISNKEFGSMYVIQRSTQRRGREYKWKCLCRRCGSIVYKTHTDLKRFKFCGCVAMGTTHGMSRTKFYAVWRAILQRCTNSNHKSFHNYGGRGISISHRWEEFVNFYKDMYSTYREGLWLERVDNNEGYSKENCIWVKPKQQGRNRRDNVLITINGVTKCFEEWIEESELKPRTIRGRVYQQGYTHYEALTTPLRGKKT